MFTVLKKIESRQDGNFVFVKVICPKCKRALWVGSHKESIEQFVAKLVKGSGEKDFTCGTLANGRDGCDTEFGVIIKTPLDTLAERFQ